MMATSVPIPVTVIGGFLGAGKTTFVNHLLATGFERTAVLVNDFGEINVDATLIRSHDGSTMTLTNGCICCSLGGGFVETMCKVLDAAVPFERIVIEASGVGDPWRIAEIALIEPDLQLDGVIVLADAGRIADLLTDSRVGDTVRGQFDHCDVVLLNKCDLIDAQRLNAARAALLAAKARLRIVETSQHSMPDLTALGSSAERSPFQAESPAEKPDHEEAFRSWSYRRDSVFDRSRFAEAIAALPAQLLRLKGSCRFGGDDDAEVFQMVEKVWTLSPHDADNAEPSSIVLVGVGTSDLPAAEVLDAILDRALTTREVVS